MYRILKPITIDSVYKDIIKSDEFDFELIKQIMKLFQPASTTSSISENKINNEVDELNKPLYESVIDSLIRLEYVKKGGMFKINKFVYEEYTNNIYVITYFEIDGIPYIILIDKSGNRLTFPEIITREDLRRNSVDLYKIFYKYGKKFTFKETPFKFYLGKKSC